MHRFTSVLSAVAALSMICATAAQAQPVPITPQRAVSFYSVQLRGVSLACAGETTEVYVYDNTNDGGAFGWIRITNLDTTAVIFENTYGNLGSFGSPGSATDSVLLPLDTNIRVEMEAREYSQAVLIYGPDTVAAAGWHDGSPNPTHTRDLFIGGSVECASLRLLESGVDSLEAKDDVQEVKLDAIEAKLDTGDAKLDAIEAKADLGDGKLDALEAKLDVLEAKLDAMQAAADAAEAEGWEELLCALDCTPHMWLPAAEGGNLEEIRAWVADQITHADNTGDLDVDITRAGQQLGVGDLMAGNGRYVRACLAYARALREVSEGCS